MPYDEDDLTPAGVIAGTWRWLPAVVVVMVVTIALGGALTLVMWAGGWWFASHDATRQAQVTQNGYSNQTTLRQEANTDFATITSIGVQLAQDKDDPSMTTELKTEQAATGNKLCGELNEITDGLPADQAQWNTANCANGTLSPNSPDYIQGAP